MVRLAEYLRRSSPGEEDKNYSIEEQHRDIERWATTQGHSIVKSYSDPGGKSYTLNRPVFQQMMADAKAKLFDMVVVGRWDRFSRIQDQQAVAIYQLQQYGVKVISVTQPTPDGPIGTLIRNNYAFAAELELYNIRERTTAGKRARIRDKKLPVTAYPLYGYAFADPYEPRGKSRYIPDSETGWVVKYIFDLYFSGIKIHAIARRLDAESIPTPTQILLRRGTLPKNKPVADEWRPHTISRILRDPTYIGKRVANRLVTVDVQEEHHISGAPVVKRKILLRDESDPERTLLPESVCPALVDEQVFLTVQLLLKRNKEDSSRNLHLPHMVMLRNKFATCGYCGKYIVPRFNQNDQQHRYYCTSNSHRAPCEGGYFSWRTAELDELVWSWVLYQFDNPDVLRKKYEQWKAEKDEGQSMEHDRLHAMDALVAETERRRKNYMLSAGEAQNDQDRIEWSHKANEESQRLRDLTVERETLQLLLRRNQESDEAIEYTIALAESIRERLSEADCDDKRRIMYAFGVSVKVWARTHQPQFEITWAFDRLHETWASQKKIYSPNDVSLCG